MSQRVERLKELFKEAHILWQELFEDEKDEVSAWLETLDEKGK
jgi:hypothetical protein